MAFNGTSLAPLRSNLVKRVHDNPGDAAAFLDLATIAHLQGRSNLREILQAHALELTRSYRQQSANTTCDAMRLLVLMAAGDFLANMPIEFLLEGANISLEIMFVDDVPLVPKAVAEHDIVLVAIAETSRNRALLRSLETALRAWPRPVVNAPDRIVRLSRAGTWELLRSAPGTAIPMCVCVDRESLHRIAHGEVLMEVVLSGCDFPIIVRPLDSHSGQGLAKLEHRQMLARYLSLRSEVEFCIAPFVDYGSPDGLYRKYRIALIERRPYACHMAISQHWMIHYFNAEMMTRPERRREEAHFIATFDDEFAVRHEGALSAIAERVGLDYIPIDCGETSDGRLLVFEVGTNMIVHAMDRADLFPYKRMQMEKIFEAFHAMLRQARHRTPGIVKTVPGAGRTHR